ncbi:transglycosylase SLT domain-containing protein [Halobacillus rhizosphaerae]|uniref:lytic transglycosylase domain-containing protein n=1 Tax=Halobacillus rhizosphaerae TaxID=3064889 RepID=UPI00398A9C11
MKVVRPLLLAGTAILLVGITVVIVDHVNEQKYNALTKENQQLMNKNEKLKTEKKYLISQPSDFKQKSGFFVWPKMEKTADHFVKESEGNFKKAWALYLVRESKRYHINPNIVFELLNVESGGTFNPKLVGPKTKYGHAYGMSQFMENTAPWIADMGGLPYKKDLLFDPYYSIELSFIYLDYLHDKYGNWDEALTAYNRGVAGLKEYKAENGHAKSGYAKTIQNNAADDTAVAVAN